MGCCFLPYWKSSGFPPDYVHCPFCTYDCYASGYPILPVLRIILVFFCLVVVVWYQLTAASKSGAQTQKRDVYHEKQNLPGVMYTWKLTQLGCKDAAFGGELLLSRSTTHLSLCFFAACSRRGRSTDSVMPMVPGNALILPSGKWAVPKN